VSIAPAIVVAERESDPGALARARAVEAPEQPKPVAREPRFRKPSAALLILSSTLAIAAAVVLPELRLRENDAELVVEAEPGDAFEAPPPAELPPIELPPELRAKLAEARAADSAPALPNAPSIDSIKPVAQLTAATTAATVVAPAPATPIEAAVQRVEPARVKVRTIEKNVVAAAASVTANANAHAPVEMAIVARKSEAAAVATPAPAQLSHPTESVAENAALPTAAEKPSAEAPAPQPLPAQVAAKPEAPAARPIVLANTAPSSPAPTALPSQAGVEIGDVNMTHGAVSRGALRAAFNQAALARCFRDAVLNRQQMPRNVTAELEISTNSIGRVTAARVSGAGLQASVVRCVEDAARLGRVRDADTGELRATVGLNFFVR
jgi:hypothetical protein